MSISNPAKIFLTNCALFLLLIYYHNPIIYTMMIQIDGLDNTFYENLVSKNGLALEFVPSYAQTQKICDMAFRHTPSAFYFVPDQFKTTNMCKSAVLHYGYFIKLVPETLLTQHMCDIAIRNELNSFVHIPDKFKTIEMWKYFVKEVSGAVAQSIPALQKHMKMHAFSMFFRAFLGL